MAMRDIIRIIRTAIYGRDMREAIAEGFEELDSRAIPVDPQLSPTSENPVQNKVVKSALDNKVDKVAGKGLSTNDYTNTDKEVVSCFKIVDGVLCWVVEE